jgi:hypothetical protein
MALGLNVDHPQQWTPGVSIGTSLGFPAERARKRRIVHTSAALGLV